jgi:hypothetical protein
MEKVRRKNFPRTDEGRVEYRLAKKAFNDAKKMARQKDKQ